MVLATFKKGSHGPRMSPMILPNSVPANRTTTNVRVSFPFIFLIPCSQAPREISLCQKVRPLQRALCRVTKLKCSKWERAKQSLNPLMVKCIKRQICHASKDCVIDLPRAKPYSFLFPFWPLLLDPKRIMLQISDRSCLHLPGI